MKNKKNRSDLFSKVMSLVKEGLTITESCVLLGTDTNRLYRVMCRDQKVELKIAKLMFAKAPKDSGRTYMPWSKSCVLLEEIFKKTA